MNEKSECKEWFVRNGDIDRWAFPIFHFTPIPHLPMKCCWIIQIWLQFNFRLFNPHFSSPDRFANYQNSPVHNAHTFDGSNNLSFMFEYESKALDFRVEITLNLKEITEITSTVEICTPQRYRQTHSIRIPSTKSRK